MLIPNLPHVAAAFRHWSFGRGEGCVQNVLGVRQYLKIEQSCWAVQGLTGELVLLVVLCSDH